MNTDFLLKNLYIEKKKKKKETPHIFACFAKQNFAFVLFVSSLPKISPV